MVMFTVVVGNNCPERLRIQKKRPLLSVGMPSFGAVFAFRPHQSESDDVFETPKECCYERRDR
jgi:hypothetical protein